MSRWVVRGIAAAIMFADTIGYTLQLEGNAGEHVLLTEYPIETAT